jgi:sec-independent protein translocase protein TatC
MALFKNKQKKNGDSNEAEMSFLDHLEVLRWHLIRSIFAVLLGAIVVFILKDYIFDYVIFAPKKSSFLTYKVLCGISATLCMEPPPLELITRELGEQFMIHIKSSIILGFVIAFPYVIFEVWKFIKPGLYDKEKKYARGFVFVCSALFVSGVLFGYFVISPFAITFLGSYSVGSEAVNSPTLASYVNYMTMFTLPSGIIFELPVVVYFLSKIGVVSAAGMRKYRKHAFVSILILSAIITPPDVVTQFLIGIPIFFLYEISIIIAKRMEKKNEKALVNA